jgi:hypothetical protein
MHELQADHYLQVIKLGEYIVITHRIHTIVNWVWGSVKVDSGLITRTDPPSAQRNTRAVGAVACICGRRIDRHITAWSRDGRVIAGKQMNL